MTTKKDLEITKNNILQLVATPAKLNMNLCLLWNNIQNGSKTIYLDEMEENVGYNPYLPSKVENIAVQYKDWHQYVISELQVEFSELQFPQAQT